MSREFSASGFSRLLDNRKLPRADEEKLLQDACPLVSSKYFDIPLRRKNFVFLVA
jgi:hypothetical protein